MALTLQVIPPGLEARFRRLVVLSTNDVFYSKEQDATP